MSLLSFFRSNLFLLGIHLFVYPWIYPWIQPLHLLHPRQFQTGQPRMAAKLMQILFQIRSAAIRKNPIP